MGDIHISMLFLLQISVPAALLYGTQPTPQQCQMPANKVQIIILLAQL